MSEYQTVPSLGITRENRIIRLVLENIKCGGCASTINKNLLELNLQQIIIDHDNDIVEFTDNVTDEQLVVVLNRLKKLGYPLVNSQEGLTALALKAKSFASCAIGKYVNR